MKPNKSHCKKNLIQFLGLLPSNAPNNCGDSFGNIFGITWYVVQQCKTRCNGNFVNLNCFSVQCGNGSPKSLTFSFTCGFENYFLYFPSNFFLFFFSSPCTIDFLGNWQEMETRTDENCFGNFKIQ